MTLEAKTLETVALAGELLIRAAAALGQLPRAEQVALADASAGRLPNAVMEALAAAAALSPAVADSMRTHPPTGLIAPPGV